MKFMAWNKKAKLNPYITRTFFTSSAFYRLKFPLMLTDKYDKTARQAHNSFASEEGETSSLALSLCPK